MLKERKPERDRDGDLESTIVRSNTFSRRTCPREIYSGGHTLVCDKSRHRGENKDFWRNHGGDHSWVQHVVSSLAVLAVGANASGALASGATAEVTPRLATSVATKVVKNMAKDSILATFVEATFAVSG